jgi:hypothetical protein
MRPYALILLWLVPVQAIAASPLEIQRQLSQAGQITDAYNPLIESFFAMARSRGDILATVKVGGTYDPDKINIVVVKAPNEGRGMKFDGFRVDQKSLFRNFVAVSPNLVLLGEHILADIVLNVFNDALGLLQAFDIAEADAEVTDPMGFASSVTTFLRVNNIRNSLYGEQNELHPLQLSPNIVKMQMELSQGPDAAYLFY